MKISANIWKSATLLLFALGAKTALADQGYAYAYIDDGSTAAVSTTYSLNPVGGPVTATHNSAGSYTIDFPNSGIGTGWAPIVTPVGATPNSCAIITWGGDNVYVQCYDPSGNPADTAFTVLAISSGNDKNISFAWANSASSPSYTPNTSYSHNPSGTIGITRSSAGVYSVNFNGLSGVGGTVQISTYSSNATCYSNGWSGFGTFTAVVNCVNPAGNPVDASYIIAIVPSGVTPTGLAYSWDDQDTTTPYTPGGLYTYNPTGSATNIIRTGTGQYTVTFARLDMSQINGGTVLATAFGGPAHCTVGWGAGPGSSLQAYVYCHNVSGGFTDSEFEILVLPPMGYAYAWIEDGSTAAVDSVYSLNPGGVPVTAVHNSTGSYTVKFPNSGIDTGWNAQVNAHGSGSAYCNLNFWESSQIGVTCYNFAGSLADSEFTVWAISNTNGSNMAFAFADQDANPSYTPNPSWSYNPYGTITATRSAAGKYDVTFNGLNGSGGTVQVTSWGSNVTCSVGDWTATTMSANVFCQNPAGAFADTVFMIAVVPAAVSPAGLGFAWASEDTTASYNAAAGWAYDPNGTVGITRSGAGQYAVSFPGLNTAGVYGGNVRVSAFGDGNSTRCKVASWSTSSPTISANVLCYSLTGTLTDSDYNIFVFAPLVGPPAAITVNGGSGQSTPDGTAFPAALSALVTDADGDPVAGVTVTFTAPASGASGTFPGSSVTDTATTTSSGVATSHTFTANNATGGYTVTTSTLGVSGSASFSLTNTPLVSVTLKTSPSGQMVSVDGNPFVASPYTVQLAPNTTHTIATETPQSGVTGTRYVWMNWSDGGAISHTVSVPGSDWIFTANFQTQYQLAISAAPAAGGSVSPASATYYDSGTVVPISATANPGYTFSGWSAPAANPSNSSTTVTVSEPINMTANFSGPTQITIQTNPPGLQISVDNTTYTAPQTLSLSQASHTIAILTATQAGSPGTQYVFSNWSDSGAASHSINVGASPATYTANFQTQYQLTISASPGTGGSVTPASGTYYNAATVVPVTATANSGFTFSGWSGPVASSSSASTSVTMNAAQSVIANFSSNTGITIQTNPPGLQISVDNVTYTAPQTLPLSQTSHTIAVLTATQAGSPGTQYVFSNWSDSGAASHSINVGASPATYTANFQTQYQLTISASPGTGGSVTPTSGTYYNAATVVPVTATANSGFTFSGWTGPVTTPSSASTSVTMNAATTVTANFSSNTGITIQTNPPGLQISVDNVTYTSPQTLPLSQTSHTIAVLTTQAGGTGTQYVFSNWSDSGAASHSINVTSSPATYTATFQTQYQLTVSASPGTGGSVTPSSGAYYNAATVVPVTAIANSGFTFSGWSGPVASPSSASTSVTMNAAATVTANFSSLTGITIQTNPPGLQVSVDNTTYTSPQTLPLSAGPHTIAIVTTTQAGGTGTQYVFSAWSDLGAASHSITVTGSPATYTATFTTQYLLTTTVSPAGAGSVAASPSPAGYYNTGTSVQLTASANSGYQFSNWSGGLSGSTNPQFITMNAPHAVTANFSNGSAACSFTFTPPAASLTPTGTSTVETCPNNSGQPNCGVLQETPVSFTVTPTAACGAWTATSSNPEFLQIVAGSETGNGSGAVSFKLLNNTHTLQQSYSITIASGGNSSSYPVTEAGSGDSEVYRQVYALYEQFLGRDPDSGGFAFWTGAGGAGLGQMADSFLTSPESFNSNFVVMAAYQAAYNTTPTFAQFTTAVASLRAGTQTLKGLFNSLTGAGYTAANLYQNLLNRAPTAGETSQANTAGLESWFETLIGYPASVTPVSTPNNEFQSTGSFHTDHTNALYTQMAYYVTVSRDPDPGGFAFWLGVANSGGPGLLFQGQAGYPTRIQILGPGTPNQGFIGSQEFQGLFQN